MLREAHLLLITRTLTQILACSAAAAAAAVVRTLQGVGMHGAPHRFTAALHVLRSTIITAFSNGVARWSGARAAVMAAGWSRPHVAVLCRGASSQHGAHAKHDEPRRTSTARAGTTHAAVPRAARCWPRRISRALPPCATADRACTASRMRMAARKGTLPGALRGMPCLDAPQALQCAEAHSLAQYHADGEHSASGR